MHKHVLTCTCINMSLNSRKTCVENLPPPCSNKGFFLLSFINLLLGIFTASLNMFKELNAVTFILFFLVVISMKSAKMYVGGSQIVWGVIKFMVLYATFNNISAISWRSVLSVEETGVPEENHRLDPSHWQTLSHNVVLSTPRHEWGSNSQL